MTKYIYSFGKNRAEGGASMIDLLGGKGANLAEMARMGIPVPAGFTITTECCNEYLATSGQFPEGFEEELVEAMTLMESEMGMVFGDKDNPLLVSCRSGARQSMPGMMETVLNTGLSIQTIGGLINKTGDERFAYDSYRRLIMMYADIVMEKAEGIEPGDNKGIRVILEGLLENYKLQKNYDSDLDLNVEDLKYLCDAFKKCISKNLNKDFPDDPKAQLMGAIGAVFKSWNGKRSLAYRRIENIPDDWGTGLTVQSMVFGNMGDDSATGVAFTRNPATGENVFFGEWLINAQGEDVVAGIRTPSPLNIATKTEHNKDVKSLAEMMPGLYEELDDIRKRLELHYHDMLDIEFTIQRSKLYMLQCRVGKRTGVAALTIAMDMLREGMINEVMAVKRVKPHQLDELLHPVVDPGDEENAEILAQGLPAGPGGAYGMIVFTPDDAVKYAGNKKQVILVREETSPEDIEGMRAAAGILTARGGMTSHAALVARGWGKCCVVGAESVSIDVEKKQMKIGKRIFKEGDVITLNGSKGYIYEDKLNMIDATENSNFKEFMQIADNYRKLGVRANADTEQDAKTALEYGAEGIGLFRTEHMFYSSSSEEPLFLLQKMILSRSERERKRTLAELFPYVKGEIKSTLAVMDGKPVTIRTLDPPLHEFVPHARGQQVELARALDVDPQEIKKRTEALLESNPMMGHRGVRLGISYPEIIEMQVRAILEAAAEMVTEGKGPQPEIMIPVTCSVHEIAMVKKIVNEIYEQVVEQYGLAGLVYKYGTMIETPRAAITADKMAEVAEFFSFGTNDLTQMTFGFSRDDTGMFMGKYLNDKLISADPFKTLDIEGVGELIKMTVERGRRRRPDIKIGICGEQGGDPDSVYFCHRNGLDYVSCSPYRIPVARLAAAHVNLEDSE